MNICNFTGKTFELEENEKGREVGVRFGYNARFRALGYVFSKLLYGEIKILCDVPVDKTIKGIGMSDSGYASIFHEKFNYTNTYYHKEPFLDINNNNHVANYNNLNFIISSDVFEHVNPYPGLHIAFQNLYKMLKSGGFLIFSVPYTNHDTIDHKEHFPELYDYKIISNNGKFQLLNTTQGGKKQVFENLCFHGGPGNVLEMRVFSKKSLFDFLEKAGFTDITAHEGDENMHKYGIYWSQGCSLIISAKK